MLARLKSAIDAFRHPEVQTRSLWSAGVAGARANADWSPPASDFAAQYNPPELIRRRARAAVRNHDVAASAVAALQRNLVAAGIVPIFKFEKARKARMQAAWRRFVDNCDYTGERDFYLMQGTVLWHWVVDGEVLVRRIFVGDELRLQVLPGEFLDSGINRPGVVNGVEFNTSGQRVAYWVFESHPSDPIRIPGSKRIPASEILHIRRTEVVGQVRGISFFSPILEKLRNIDQYDRSMQIKARVSALWCAFLHGPDDNKLNSTRDKDGTAVAAMEPGTVVDIGNSEVEFPPHAQTAEYGPFMKTLLRGCAAAMGVPYATLTGDLSDTSYASSRVGRIEFARQTEQLQWSFIWQFCRPVLRWWLEVEMLAGRLPMLDGIEASYMDVITWAPPPLPLLDPKNETDARIKAIRAVLTTRERVLAEDGYDIAEVDEQIEAANESADQKKLTLDVDPRKVTMQGQQQQGSGTNEPAAAD